MYFTFSVLVRSQTGPLSITLFSLFNFSIPAPNTGASAPAAATNPGAPAGSSKRKKKLKPSEDPAFVDEYFECGPHDPEPPLRPHRRVYLDAESWYPVYEDGEPGFFFEVPAAPPAAQDDGTPGPAPAPSEATTSRRLSGLLETTIVEGDEGARSRSGSPSPVQ